jgi:uncharacterized protein YjdB
MRELVGVLQFPASGVLAPVPAGMRADQMLLAGVRDMDIALALAFPEAASPTDTIQLLVDGQPVGDEVLVDPYVPDKDIVLVLPATPPRTEGVHTLNYKLLYRSGTGEEQEFGPANQQFVADYTAPAGLSVRPPDFPQDVVENGVTPDRLSADEDGNEYLPATVRSYFLQLAGDTLVGYIDGTPSTALREVTLTDEGKDIELRFTRDKLEEAMDGEHDFTFDIVDRAGNRSAMSAAIRLYVLMHALIPDVMPPRVPAASDGLLDHADMLAARGVSVDIPANALIQAGDTIVLAWGTYEAPPRAVDAGDIGKDPVVTIVVPYAEAYGVWFDTSAGANIRVGTDVTYRIMRGDVLAGKPKAPTIVPVNLSIPGGEDPDPETPEHEALQRAIVFSASGHVNFIPIAEQTLDGTVEVPWVSALPDRDVFIVGDILTIRYGQTTLDPPRVINAADVAAGAPLRMNLSKDAIAAEGSGVVAVRYTVARPLAEGGTNIATSPTQNVKVEAEADLPGGGTLWEGTFKELIGSDVTLGPKEIAGGTPFTGGYVGALVGDTIRFEFQFVAGNPHLPGETPIADRFHVGFQTLEADGAPIQYHIDEDYLNYHGTDVEVMHIHARYFVTRGQSSPVESPETRVILDCRGDVPSFTIVTTPVRLIGTATYPREARNGRPPYKYFSSHPEIVEVPDPTIGLIRGVSDGFAVITASDSGNPESSKSYSVTVVGNSLLTIDPTPQRIVGTDTHTRHATGGLPTYTYVSSAPEVAAVLDGYHGTIQGRTDGDAVITVSDTRDDTASYPVTVVGNKPFHIESTLVRIIGKDTYARRATGGLPPYHYESNAPDIVNVPDPLDGLIQGVKDGTAHVFARDSAHGSGHYPVEVVGNTPFSIDPSRMDLAVGDQEQRQARGGVPDYSYSSADSAVATVAADGVVTGLAVGSTSVTGRDSASHSAFYPVSVTEAFVLETSDMLLSIGESRRRTASGGLLPYTYTAANVDVATVSGDGDVTGKNVGVTSVTVHDSAGHAGSFQVAVTDAFRLDTSDMHLRVSESQQRQAMGGTPPYGYSSGNAAIATVTSSGLAVGRAAGSTTVTARDQAGHSASYKVYVEADFSFDPSDMRLGVGESRRRQATGGVRPYSYSSANEAIASVSSSGEVTGRGAGSTRISVADSATPTHRASCDVIVSTTLSLTGPSSIKVNDTFKITAHGGSPAYRFASSDPAIARMTDDNGNGLGVSPGKCTITVTDSLGATASRLLTVTAASADFYIDPANVSLSGTASYERNASGGEPPYQYSSSAAQIVRVPDASQGTIRAVSDGSATITAKDSAQGSGRYVVTVTGNASPVFIDPTPVALTGVIYRLGATHPPTNPPAGSYIDRRASGGRPPYTYRAENPAVVNVNASTGRVISAGSGSTRVVATDSAGKQAFYSVSVSNVQVMFGTGLRGTYTQCRVAAEGQGGRIPSLDEWQAMRNAYGGNPDFNGYDGLCWTTTQPVIAKRWGIGPTTGRTGILIDFGIGGSAATGYGFKAG